jgi:hypothetical protein
VLELIVVRSIRQGKPEFLGRLVGATFIAFALYWISPWSDLASLAPDLGAGSRTPLELFLARMIYGAVVTFVCFVALRLAFFVLVRLRLRQKGEPRYPGRLHW